MGLDLFEYGLGRISLVRLLALWLSSCRPHVALAHATRSGWHMGNVWGQDTWISKLEVTEVWGNGNTDHRRIFGKISIGITHGTQVLDIMT
jgi:hypothetical protein